VLRVLTISKPYVAASYRDKISELARIPGITAGLVTPPAWGTQAFEPAKSPEPFETWQVPILANGRNHFHVYRSGGIKAAFSAFRPAIANIEEEHYSAVTFQLFRQAVTFGAKPVFYTWQNIAKRYPPPFSWIERYVFRHAAAGVVGNAEAGEILRAKGYRGLIREIPQMGFTPGRFVPARSDEAARKERKRALGLDPDAFVVCYAGRLVEEKGLGSLVHAAGQLHAMGITPRVKIVLLGTGPEQEHLLRLARSTGAEASVHFAGSVASTEVPQWFQAVDALALPSLTRANWKEQFGRVLVEAMAAGAVVIGSSSGEIPNVIGTAGMVFPEGDSAALASAIALLARDPARTTALRAAGQVRAAEHFSNQIIARKFADLFFEIAGKDSPSSSP